MGGALHSVPPQMARITSSWRILSRRASSSSKSGAEMEGLSCRESPVTRSKSFGYWCLEGALEAFFSLANRRGLQLLLSAQAIFTFLFSFPFYFFFSFFFSFLPFLFPNSPLSRAPLAGRAWKESVRGLCSQMGTSLTGSAVATLEGSGPVMGDAVHPDTNPQCNPMGWIPEQPP